MKKSSIMIAKPGRRNDAKHGIRDYDQKILISHNFSHENTEVRLQKVTLQQPARSSKVERSDGAKKSARGRYILQSPRAVTASITKFGKTDTNILYTIHTHRLSSRS